MSPAKGSRLENSWIKRPTNSSSRVSNFPRKRVIDELSHQNVMNQVGFSTNWRNHPRIIYNRKWIRNEISKMIRTFPIDNKRLAPILEYFLFLSATSKEDYMNNVTLNQRVQFLLDAGIADYNGMPKEGPSTSSIVHEQLPCLRDHGSSIPTFADMNVLCDNPVSGGGSYFPQQHANNLDMDTTRYSENIGTIQNNNSINFPTTKGKSVQSENLNMKLPQIVAANISEHSNRFPQQHANNLNMDLTRYSGSMGNIQNNDSISFPTTIGKSLKSEDLNMKLPQLVSMDISEHSNLLPQQHSNNFETDLTNNRDCLEMIMQNNECMSFPNMTPSFKLNFQKNFTHDGNTEAMLRPTKIQKTTGSTFGVSLVNNASADQLSYKTVQPHSIETLVGVQQQQLEFPFSSIDGEVDKYSVEEFTNLVLGINEINSNVMVDTFGQTLKTNTFPSKGLEVAPERQDVMNSNNLNEFDIGLSSIMRTVSMDAIPTDGGDIKGRNEFDQAETNVKKKVIEPKPDQELQKLLSTIVGEIQNNVSDDTFGQTFKSEMIRSKGLDASPVFEEPDPEIHGVIDIGFNQEAANAKNKASEPKADQEKQTKSSNTTINVVSLIDLFTRDQIKEHINSLRKESVQTTVDGTCQLCTMKAFYFEPVQIYCLHCQTRIKRNAKYFCIKGEESDAERCFCSSCYNRSKGGCIIFNGTSVCKTLFEQKKNDEVLEEPWVECNKCERWQHQICALYNSKRDLDCTAEYTCPFCHVKEIENGMHVPLPKTTIFGAKDLPRTMLSDHLEKRLFEHLMQERADWEKIEGNENLDEVVVAKSLTVREVLSADKHLIVEKQFLDIVPEEKYPAEFSYRSRVILLFQQIEGADVCIFGMYVQEYGSECANPNQRCIYISYLDSVNHFMPRRQTMSGGALRTFVYHEILIGYLDFCKKRGFTKCYIWSCPPKKEDNYILHCHPKTQKTPKDDKLVDWYHSMLKKATEENVVVGLTDVYEHFFVPTEKWNSKVTAARLPYFYGDYWCNHAMELAIDIEKECGGEYEKTLKKVVKNRSLKAMGHVNPSNGNAKDIMVMQKLGQIMLQSKKNFIVAHLQYSCMHCHEAIVSGKRWFCTECKKFQECERCHTADVHTSINGEVHTLCQVVVDDIPFNTEQNDIIIENELFESRSKFLSFCKKNQFQFDTLRRAKYSTMMILDHLKGLTLLTVGTVCSICSQNVLQQSWKCEVCPKCVVCSACYKDKGAGCHQHKLTQKYSTTPCLSRNQELNKISVPMRRKLMEVLEHVSQCSSTITERCCYRNCFQMKKLLVHANQCTTRVSGGCCRCKKVLQILTYHSKNCKDSECRIPHCMDKLAELIAKQSESHDIAAAVESNKIQ
ncbi:histone acetyltransferase HAC12-like isoform X2 [Cicer arietinum]|uniref:histone acetyltransferase HAC12-like isoform X2 n=1 Tax=Cicer arietinum TaxID=3827 RepID=UPI003CC5F7B0